MTPYSRKSLESSLDALGSQFTSQTGQEICLALTEALDKYLIHFGEHFFDQVGVFAIGGYGRRELSRYSDLDLFILYENQPPEQIQEWLKPFLHPLWDARLEVKYSVHTFEELETKISEDTDFATALLDYRPLESHQKIVGKFTEWITAHFEGGKPDFLNAKLAEDKRRRKKYGETYKLIEPNIKESAGGLRDLHTLQWIAVAKGWRKPGISKENIPGTLNFLEWMLNEKYITVREFAALKDAFNFLLQIRHGIHMIETKSKRKSNQLDINIRTRLAKEFGYQTKTQVDVQAFMQAYYRAARSIEYIHISFMHEHLLPVDNETARQPLPEFPGLYRSNGSLDADETTELPRDAVVLMQIFLYAQTNHLHLRQQAREKIEQAVHVMEDSRFQTKEVGLMLKRIFQEPDAGDILRILLHTEILSKIIPEIAQIRRLHIPSRFHYYTVDEHSFRAIDNLQERALIHTEDDPYRFSETYQNLEDVYPLYLALLLHDIGKAAENEDHEEHGSKLVNTILTRLQLGEYVESVAFLIRHHLLMEEVAFRRDTNRPEVIERFASEIENTEKLRMLYLLTFADISAVSPNLWTDWKATLLYELFWKTRRFLEGKPIYPAVEVVTELHEDPELEKLYEQHLALMENRYIAQFTEAEIYQHLKAIEQIKNADGKDLEKSQSVQSFVESGEPLTKVTVITGDRPRLLSLLCGTFTSLGYNIIDAAIFTREDDLVIDQFRVVPILDDESADDKMRVKLQNLLEEVFAGKKSVEKLVQKAKQQWRWRQQALPEFAPKVDWTREDDIIVLEVTGRDSTGLLYQLTHKIAENNFKIESARIHTENQSITDIFYITPATREDGVVASEKFVKTKLEQLREDLLEFLS